MKYVYAGGAIVKTIAGGTSGIIPVIAKFYLSTGALVYFKEVSGFAGARFTRMSPLLSGGTLTGIYVAGESTLSGGITKATIFKIKPSDGTLDTGFDADGWRQYSAPSPNGAKPTGTNGIVTLFLCGPNSNSNACAPPCTNCFAAQSMMSAAANESDPWSQQNLYNQAINLYWKEDNTQAALDAIKNHFPNDPNLALGLLVNAGNYEAAQTKVATLGLDESSKGWATLYQVAIDLGKNGKSILQLDASQEAKLFQVAQGVSPAKYAAQNILTFAKGYVFARPVEVWKEEGLQGESGDRSTEKAFSDIVENNWLSLLPLPPCTARTYGTGLIYFLIYNAPPFR